MELSFNQKKELFENGYVHIPGVIPQVMVDKVKKAINYSLGEEGMDKEKLTQFRAQSYCPELSETETITSLFHRTPVYDLVDSVIDLKRTNPITAGQIALRFPGMYDPVPAPSAHIDGMYTPTNGVPKGTIQNFTALVGVLLSDLSDDYAGNFTVWPRTHRLFEKHFREHGPESLLNGMPPVDMPEPIQIKGKAGDVVVCHYQLGHGAALNISANIRYACFFRIRHEEVKSNWKAPMTNIWMHYRENMQQIAEANEKVNT